MIVILFQEDLEKLGYRHKKKRGGTYKADHKKRRGCIPCEKKRRIRK